MSWRLAKSLEYLRMQINAAYPNRSKASDGTIGDKAHAHRKSDHNPDKHGIVRALDITHDPRNGVDSQKIADDIVASRDKRVKYIISNGRIISGSKGPDPWVWRKYPGANPHDKHVHVSVLGGEPDGIGDTAGAWMIKQQEPQPDAAPRKDWPTLRRGAKSHTVRLLQEMLIKWGAEIKADGDFGKRTEAAVKAFQKSKALVPDGVVGPYTWRALRPEGEV